MSPASSTSQGIDSPPTPSTPSESAAEWTAPSSQQPGKPFPQAKVAFAVDVSGSTMGATLRAEKHFITAMSELINPRPRFDAKILPWDNTTYRIRGVSQVNTLQSEGGTDPGVLLKSGFCRRAILDSDLWFLMTDGLITDGTRSAFAENLAKKGVHGTNCVIVIFGDPALGPGGCDISVGISVFAVVPNCAFLFYNTENGEIRLFQTRGAFKSLLKGQAPPVFDKSSKWNSLPLVNPSDFAGIQVPPPQKLSANEVALQGDLVINLDDLFGNRLSREKVSSIFANEDNLSTVVMTSRTRNQQGAFQHWIQQQAIAIDDPLQRPRDDLHHRARNVFTEVIDLLRRGRTPPEQVRQKLRQTYLENMKQFVREIQTNEDHAQERQGVIDSASAWSNMNFNYSPSLCSPVPWKTAQSRYTPQYVFNTPSAQSCVSAPAPPAAPLRGRPQYYAAYVQSYRTWEDSIRDPHIRRLLYTPGFQSTGGAFTGTCPICDGRVMKMAFLFRDLPASTSTVGFPPPGSRTRLAFPFAMGNFHETDVLSSTICCDPCSSFAVRTASSMNPEETINAAIPLVSYAENKASINDALDKIFSLRFAEEDLPMVLLSVLLTARPRFVAAASEQAASLTAATTVSAIDWAVRDLLHAIPVLKELSESFSHPDAKAPLWPLAYVLSESFTDETHPPNQPLMCYPLPGFIVLLAASENAGIKRQLRELAVLRRFLFLLVEEFHRARTSIPVKSTPSTTVLSLIFGNLLWEQQQQRQRQEGESPSPPPDSGIDIEPRKPILSVSIASLAETALLSEQSYGVMQRAEEFGALQSGLLAGVDWVVGLFLHALYRTAVKAPGLSAWEMFGEIMKTSAMVEGVTKVRGLGEEEAKGLYDELMGVFESSA